MTVNVTPAVRAVANKFGVNLDALSGTGAGGRITVNDVRNAAGPAAQTRAPARSSNAPSIVEFSSPRAVLMKSSTLENGIEVQVDQYARNPLLDDYRQVNPDLVAAQTRDIGPAPTLFQAGDLPVFTASGIDPSQLLTLPWEARHAAASASGPDASRMFEKYSPGATPERALEAADKAATDHAFDQGNVDYATRMETWIRAVGSNSVSNWNRLGGTRPAASR